MNKYIILATSALILASCDARVSTAPAESKGPDKVIEKNTTIINPPGKVEEKKTTTTTEIKK